MGLVDETAFKLRNNRFALVKRMFLGKGLWFMEYFIIEKQVEFTMRIIRNIAVLLG
jgi:hypothetical protein